MVLNLVKGVSKIEWVKKIDKLGQNLKEIEFLSKKENEVKFVRKSGYFAMSVSSMHKWGCQFTFFVFLLVF